MKAACGQCKNTRSATLAADIKPIPQERARRSLHGGSSRYAIPGGASHSEQSGGVWGSSRIPSPSPPIVSRRALGCTVQHVAAVLAKTSSLCVWTGAVNERRSGGRCRLRGPCQVLLDLLRELKACCLRAGNMSITIHVQSEASYNVGAGRAGSDRQKHLQSSIVGSRIARETC